MQLEMQTRKSQAVKLAATLGIVAAFQIAGADVALAQSAGGAFGPLQTAVQMIVDFSKSAIRAATHCLRAVPLHFGQWRLRQEL